MPPRVPMFLGPRRAGKTSTSAGASWRNRWSCAGSWVARAHPDELIEPLPVGRYFDQTLGSAAYTGHAAATEEGAYGGTLVRVLALFVHFTSHLEEPGADSYLRFI